MPEEQGHEVIVESPGSAHSVVDIGTRGRPTAEVRSRAAEPAIDCLESQISQSDSDILVGVRVELPVEFVASIRGTTHEISAFEASDDLLDVCLLQTEG